MSTTIFRIEKHKNFAGLNKAGAHHHRLMDTPNADPNKLHLNKVLKGNNNLSGTIKRAFEKYGIKPRKNAVLAMDGMLTLSPKAFKSASDIELFKEQSNNFLQKEFGGKYISGVYHGDEKSPHIHFTVIPAEQKDGKWKLNARDQFNKERLSQLQRNFFSHMQQFFPELDPPQHGRKASHKKIKQFYEELENDLSKLKNDILEDCRNQIMNNQNPNLIPSIKNTMSLTVKAKAAELEGQIGEHSNELLERYRGLLSDFDESMENAIKQEVDRSLEVLSNSIDQRLEKFQTNQIEKAPAPIEIKL
ncbi:plasmid recombination protein [Vibrio parahaemolyticus]|nr:plasmid recombination protein [Vibrio parahaemolyticus]